MLIKIIRKISNIELLWKILQIQIQRINDNGFIKYVEELVDDGVGMGVVLGAVGGVLEGVVREVCDNQGGEYE